MHKILFCSISFILISCAKESKNNSLNTTKIEKREQHTNLQSKNSFNSSVTDTIFSERSPIKIISAKILNNPYSNHKDIRITYKNTSKKSIQAINFEWNSKNAFEKPSSGKYFFVKGYCNGYSTTLIKPTQIASMLWEDFSTDANKIISSNAYLVVYTDGTIWKLKKSKP